MKRQSLIATFFGLVLAFLFYNSSCFAAEISENQTWSGDIEIAENTTIPNGVAVTVAKGAEITFEDSAILEVFGNLDIRGTVPSPVTISGEGYSIIANEGARVSINNADISGGGSVDPGYTDPQTGIEFSDYLGAITGINKSHTEIQATNFHDNRVATYVAAHSSEGRFMVQRSKFEDNTYDAVNNNGQIRYNYNYNWWGDEDGPDPAKLIGTPLDIEFIRESEELRDPIVVIPGILGSTEQNEEWVFDPIFHTYDTLVRSLESNGYEEGSTLFLMPYDWYRSNVHTANDLRDRISEIRQQTNWPKVDIVAHSMGGLVARQYIENDQYLDDVDQLITLGTPHNGSPKAYFTWENGSFGQISVWNQFAEIFFEVKAVHEGYASRFELVRFLPIASVQELLPIYSYIREASDGEIRPYPTGYPYNDLLDSLSQVAKLERLKKVEFTNIVGNLSADTSTVNVIRVQGFGEPGEEWEHGKPEGHDLPFGDRGMEYGEGDGTVPLSSAKDILADLELELNATHNNLPTAAARQVYQVLTGDDGFTGVDPLEINSMLVASVYSPIDIQIISPSGKRIGKNFGTEEEYNEIPLAFYTGFDTENEFITIPNPEDGEYRILIQGTDEGEYGVEMNKITEGENPTEEATESRVWFDGAATPGNVEEKKVMIEAEQISEVPDEPSDTNAPVISIVSPKEKSYINSQRLSLKYSASDDMTAPDSLLFDVWLDGEVFEEDQIDLSLLPLGEHELRISVQDEAGNMGEDTVSFSTRTSFAALKRNISHYHSEGLIKKSSVRNQLLTEVSRIEILLQLREFLAAFPGPWLRQAREALNHEIDQVRKHFTTLVEKQASRGIIISPADEKLLESIASLVD